MDNDGTTTRNYHHGNLRAALIDAGLAALEKSDQAAFSLRAIAREVGVSANAAYRHFASKDDLLSALAAEGFRRFAAQQAAAAQQGAGNIGELRTATAKAYVSFAQAHPALFRLMFSRFLYASSSEDLKVAAATAFQLLLQASAQQAGVAPDSEQAMMTAVANWSMVHGLSHLLLDGQLSVFGFGLDQMIDGIVNLQGANRPKAT
ncbi:MAG TPA: TetR/AcrR family transcriptional regulator [Aquabacterium sp.]|uniref:TetR/AcrR family transcriptional regulator n=1 Tax=Aquabacterium sp. TaxID=1872578 RepID=UPI002E359447|nr:TetR/AcrR family transcriptional regulator [Aquabacterium sp.]HEX5354662.1 TetR/AcrR family transcriptional regulator [Aquabacterium sp.]